MFDDCCWLWVVVFFCRVFVVCCVPVVGSLFVVCRVVFVVWVLVCCLTRVAICCSWFVVRGLSFMV